MAKNRINDRTKILLIDEDEGTFYLLKRTLQAENYRIYVASGGKQGKELCASICPDLILTDINLSDMDGENLIHDLRVWTKCPLIVISEKNAYTDKVRALYAGADDYVVKPFHEQELKARIIAAMRRRIPDGQGEVYHAKELKIDFLKRLVSIAGEEIHLSPVEYRMLECLAFNAGTVVTYQMLLEKIWGPYANGGSRILRVNMTNIRKKIEKTPIEPVYITTIPRVGYRMLENGNEKISADNRRFDNKKTNFEKK